MTNKIYFLLCCLLSISFAGHTQVLVKGTVLDKETKEPLIGVTIFEPASKVSTITDLDGTFNLKLPSAANRRMELTYIGYLKQELAVAPDMGTILLAPDAVTLGDVVVTSSIAIRRKTPVALSIIEPEQIETKLGTKEFPEILRSTPSIYVTRQGGGFGDSSVRMRGFKSENIAVMVNGVPMNDMEWGGLYWSNWTGLSDVTRSNQVQRGLGASKVSAPSIGGSINILTKTTDAEKGGTFYYGMGNNGYSKLSFSVSTGLTDNGWAITLLGSKTEGDGYILGTNFEGYTYFLNVSKIINESHQLSFTGFGAPQWHFQRYNGDLLMVSQWQQLRDGYQYNPTYGVDADGVQKSANYNHYHKPQLSLNHYWTIDPKSALSTALYLSLGDGGGYAWRGSNYSSLYGTETASGMLNTGYRSTSGGYMDYGKLQAENAASPNGSFAAIADSRNNHVWVGLLSTYSKKLSSNIDFYGGIDLRYYEGLHDGRLVDLMGGQYFIDPQRATVRNKAVAGNPAYVNEKLNVGDIVYRDNTGYVTQAGVFGQVEYSQDRLSAFLSGSVSNSAYWKVDRFYYDNQKSDVGNFIGFNLKAGANYNLTANHNVFANIGSISRAPFMSGGYFTSIHTSNVTNPNAVNEKLFSAELGYGYRSRNLTAQLNVFHTQWMDKTMIRSLGSNIDDATINIQGVDALHQGVELEATYKPIQNLDITGMFSIGNYRWTNSEATGYAYNKSGQAVDKSNNPVEPLSPDHAKSTLNMEGTKIGGSPQIFGSLGFRYKFLKSFAAGLTFDCWAKNYADFAINSPNAGSTINYHTPWEIPGAGIVDLNAQYHFRIAGLNATLLGNIDNLLDQSYVADAKDLNAANPNIVSDWTNTPVMYGFGRTFSVAIKIKF